MWRLWHKLFGWDYVYWELISMSGISRVRVDPGGAAYFRILGLIIRVTDPSLDDILFLTCSPEKYLNQPIINKDDRGESSEK